MSTCDYRWRREKQEVLNEDKDFTVDKNEMFIIGK